MVQTLSSKSFLQLSKSTQNQLQETLKDTDQTDAFRLLTNAVTQLTVSQQSQASENKRIYKSANQFFEDQAIAVRVAQQRSETEIQKKFEKLHENQFMEEIRNMIEGYIRLMKGEIFEKIEKSILLLNEIITFNGNELVLLFGVTANDCHHYQSSFWTSESPSLALMPNHLPILQVP
ncbi:hypothetical protein FGO68_gene6497 [Halteria grandinella]|uniref:Uncharacterized protein n=1 Tax=Halteria grandinella TaxID=5974 RepID=A0A8J8SVX8_HALGN|nr:hypothetical protein FGO68_gene6497 [Halteria grandinella]